MFPTHSKLFGAKTSKKSPKPQSYRPRMEGLEDRMLMAGNITATLGGGGDLFLTEATGQVGRDNGVKINQLAPGVIQVEGDATLDGSKSLVNGRSSQVFNVTGGLFVRFGVGRDNVSIGTTAPIFLKNVQIDVGNDSNENFSHFDKVSISSLNTGSLSINTGAGNDTVTIAASAVSSLANPQVLINTGRGSDTLSIRNLEMDHFIAFMDPFNTSGRSDDSGADVVSMDQVVASHNIDVITDPKYLKDGVTLVTTGATDTVTMNHVSAATQVGISTFGGKDTVKMNDVHAVDHLFADLGAGDDALEMLNCSADEIEVGGGAGFDRFSRKDVFFGTHMRIVGFEKIQTLLLLNNNVDSGLTLSAK